MILRVNGVIVPAPTALPIGAAGGDLGGTYPNPTVTGGTNHGHANTQVSGLGNASTRNVGTTAGTVATGDDSRITGALAAVDARVLPVPAVGDALKYSRENAAGTGYELRSPSDVRSDIGAGTSSLVLGTTPGTALAGDTAIPVVPGVVTDTTTGLSPALAAGQVAVGRTSNTALATSLGGAAYLAVGTTAGTVAAGDDSRFAGAGTMRSIRVPFTFANIGTPVDSTATIPDGAYDSRTCVVVTTPFSGGAAPTCAVSSHGSGSDTTLSSTAASDLTIAGEYDVETLVVCTPATATGVVRVTLGGTATAGAGYVVTYYSVPQA